MHDQQDLDFLLVFHTHCRVFLHHAYLCTLVNPGCEPVRDGAAHDAAADDADVVVRVEALLVELGLLLQSEVIKRTIKRILERTIRLEQSSGSILVSVSGGSTEKDRGFLGRFVIHPKGRHPIELLT